MIRSLRFLLAFVGGMALLAWGATTLVQRTTRRWYEQDLLLRARLAVRSARPALVSAWADPARLAVRSPLEPEIT